MEYVFPKCDPEFGHEENGITIRTKPTPEEVRQWLMLELLFHEPLPPNGK